MRSPRLLDTYAVSSVAPMSTNEAMKAPSKPLLQGSVWICHTLIHMKAIAAICCGKKAARSPAPNVASAYTLMASRGSSSQQPSRSHAKGLLRLEHHPSLTSLHARELRAHRLTNTAVPPAEVHQMVQLSQLPGGFTLPHRSLKRKTTQILHRP